jgi:hypothetical protein
VADDTLIVNREFDADNSVIKLMAAVGKTAAIPLRTNEDVRRRATATYATLDPRLSRTRPSMRCASGSIAESHP